eukprot:COSAG04_NODE_5556_length_1571_cov_1.207880_4_plen_81_part_01
MVNSWRKLETAGRLTPSRDRTSSARPPSDTRQALMTWSQDPLNSISPEACPLPHTTALITCTQRGTLRPGNHERGKTEAYV